MVWAVRFSAVVRHDVCNEIFRILVSCPPPSLGIFI